MDTFMKTYDFNGEFEYAGDKTRLDPEIETNLFRICQEALTNIAKHAKANVVNISIHVDKQEILLKMKDDGHGFAVKKYMKDHNRQGIGLFSMKERAESLDGTFQIRSEKEQGTKIEVRIARNSRLF